MFTSKQTINILALLVMMMSLSSTAGIISDTDQFSLPSTEQSEGFGIYEPGANSDAYAITSTSARNLRDGDYAKINWQLNLSQVASVNFEWLFNPTVKDQDEYTYAKVMLGNYILFETTDTNNVFSSLSFDVANLNLGTIELESVQLSFSSGVTSNIINSDLSSLTARSDKSTFKFNQLTLEPTTSVPEPATLVVFLLSLFFIKVKFFTSNIKALIGR
jgi:hypothetical protein